MTPVEPLAVFVAVVLCAAYVQTVSGFALGLIAMGTVGVLHLAPIPFAALVISLLSLVNVATALRGRTGDIQRTTLLASGLAMAPMVLVGLATLHWLEGRSVEALRNLLGGFILVAGLLLMLRPHPRATPAPRWKAALWGAVGGLFGGLFSTAGPPIVFHLYREPIPIPAIRATLLAFFAAATLTRLVSTGASGAITREVLLWALLATPAVLAGTWAGRHFPPRVPDLAMRRFAFVLLAALGGALLIG